jgi:pectate lyase
MIIASQGGDMWNGKDYTGGDNKKGTLSGQMGGMIKSYGDVMITPSHFYAYGEEDVEGEFDAYVASSRDEKVPETVQAKVGDDQGNGTYNNFDTDPDIMYEYKVDTAEEAVEKVTAYAGRVDGGDFKWTFNNETDDSFHDIDENLLAAIKSYESSLIAVAGNKIEVVESTTLPTDTPDPSATKAPTATNAPSAPSESIEPMPYNTISYAKDWFGEQSVSAGSISADGYVLCYKGSGNSYKSNSFSADGVTATRGYQTKGLSNRSFCILPQGECDVTIYFYSAARRIALYTTSSTEAAAEYTPEESGDRSYTYHYTETGTPIYIAGPDGDIYISAVKTGEGTSDKPTDTDEPKDTDKPSGTDEPTSTDEPKNTDKPSGTDEPSLYPYEITSAVIGSDGKIGISLKNDVSDPDAVVIAAAYTEDGRLAGVSSCAVSETSIEINVPENGKVRLFVRKRTDMAKPLSEVKELQG